MGIGDTGKENLFKITESLWKEGYHNVNVDARQSMPVTCGRAKQGASDTWQSLCVALEPGGWGELAGVRSRRVSVEEKKSDRQGLSSQTATITLPQSLSLQEQQ